MNQPMNNQQQNMVRDTLRLRVSPGRESLLYQEIVEMDEDEEAGDGGKEVCVKRRRRLDSPPPLPPPRPRKARVERRRKNLFRHLGLEGLGVGEEHLLRLTLSEGEEEHHDRTPWCCWASSWTPSSCHSLVFST